MPAQPSYLCVLRDLACGHRCLAGPKMALQSPGKDARARPPGPFSTNHETTSAGGPDRLASDWCILPLFQPLLKRIIVARTSNPWACS